MSTRLAAVCVALAACTSPAVGSDPEEAGDGKTDGVAGIHDVRCAGAPDAGPRSELRHTHNKVTIALGDPIHRGVDLVAAADDDTQIIEGDILYGADDALDDEDVDVFACRRGMWRNLGRTRTDDDGHFALELAGSERLPIGLRDLFVSVAGDRSGARFLALVADHARLAASDVDGTLTSFEAAFAGDAFDVDVPIHDHAAETFRTLAGRGLIPIYVTSRSRRHTQSTRDWLTANQMPRGPLRLSPHTVLPGSATVAYKTAVLSELAATQDLVLGVGNRASDITAYAAAGVPGDRIFIKLPEFSLEVSGPISRGEAVGIEHYPGALDAVH